MSGASSTRTLGDAPGPRTGDGEDWVQHLLELARLHLGMELSWVSRFVDDQVVVAAVSGAVDDLPLSTGFTSPLGDSYSVRVRDGSTPAVLTDVASDPVVSVLPAARALPPGSYVAVPLQGPAGEIFGTLSCINRDPDLGLRLRDAQFLHLLADLMTALLDPDGPPRARQAGHPPRA